MSLTPRYFFPTVLFNEAIARHWGHLIREYVNGNSGNRFLRAVLLVDRLRFPADWGHRYRLGDKRPNDTLGRGMAPVDVACRQTMYRAGYGMSCIFLRQVDAHRGTGRACQHDSCNMSD